MSVVLKKTVLYLEFFELRGSADIVPLFLGGWGGGGAEMTLIRAL